MTAKVEKSCTIVRKDIISGESKVKGTQDLTILFLQFPVSLKLFIIKTGNNLFKIPLCSVNQGSTSLGISHPWTSTMLSVNHRIQLSWPCQDIGT